MVWVVLPKNIVLARESSLKWKAKDTLPPSQKNSFSKKEKYIFLVLNVADLNELV
jgi:hypothetical protein